MTDAQLKMLSNYLCPPGEGVYTVHTASDKKKKLQQLLYGNQDAKTMWLESLETIASSKPIILGVPSDAGGGILRGANWGPLCIREALYQNLDLSSILDIGDVRVIPQLLLDEYVSDKVIESAKTALYGDSNNDYAVSPLSICEHVCDVIYQNYEKSRILAFGGDHSVSYPLVKSYLKHQIAKQKRVAVIHFDAHTDLLESRLGIDVCFGSWVYHVLPYLVKPSDFIQIGIRSSGHDKSHWESNYGIQQFWSREVKSTGVEKCANDILNYLKDNEISECYISCDIDVLDSSEAGATGTPEKDGLFTKDVTEMIALIRKGVLISGCDLVEVAPFVQYTPNLDEPQKTLTAASTISDALLKALS